MNKIIVNGETIHFEQSDEKIEVTLSDKLDFYDIQKMNIHVLKDTILQYSYTGEMSKLEITIEIEDQVNFEIQETKNSDQTKIQTSYYLGTNSHLKIQKLYDVGQSKELDLFYLNGGGADVTYVRKGVCTGESKWIMYMYHDVGNTHSKITNQIITKDEGSVDINLTSVIGASSPGCTVQQNNRIMNQNLKSSKIEPNLVIEDNNVEASHSAHIAPFEDDILYYMETKGLPKKEAEHLLIKGFLQMDTMEIDEILKKYWR